MFFAVQYMIFMFTLKSSEALHFDKHNIIEFLKDFEKLCDEYKVTVKKNELSSFVIINDKLLSL